MTWKSRISGALAGRQALRDRPRLRQALRALRPHRLAGRLGRRAIRG